MKIAEEQPLIEDYLGRYQDKDIRGTFLNRMAYVPELQSWYKNYQEGQRDIRPNHPEGLNPSGLEEIR